VELGSLGHWGEWHVHEAAGKMPPEEIRAQYAAVYAEAFPNTRLLMRRPFKPAAAHGMGLFNDAAGSVSATRTWLGWIENGGDFDGERGALVPMPEAWKTAPVGGELTTSSTPEKLLSDTEKTASLFSLSHASWIGPHSFSEISDPLLEKKLTRVMNTLGYRLRVRELRLSPTGNGQAELSLSFVNDGNAPFYYPWPVLLRISLADGGEHVLPLPVDVESLLPGVTRTVTVPLPDAAASSLSVRITDPMTGKPAVRFAMDTEWKDGWQSLL